MFITGETNNVLIAGLSHVLQTTHLMILPCDDQVYIAYRTENNAEPSSGQQVARVRFFCNTLYLVRMGYVFTRAYKTRLITAYNKQRNV